MNISLEDNLYSHFKLRYNNSPQAVKGLVGGLYRLLPSHIKYGRIYNEIQILLEKSQWWSKKEILEYQWEKLECLLKHSYQNIPYYKNLFDENGICLKDIQNFNDYRKIPFLTKEIIRNNINSLLAGNFEKSNLISITTGGSTGTPLQLYYQKGLSRPTEIAFTHFGWKRMGYNLGDRVVVLRGESINLNQKIPYYYDPIKNRLVLSSYQMIEKNIPDYIKQINKFKPDYLHVYPSSLSILAQFMSDNDLSLEHELKGIIGSSETLYDWQFDLFKKVFGCNVFSWYGSNEFVALAGGCELEASLHFFSEFSYVEFIPEKGGDTALESDSICEIVGTNFCNFAMPLLRYRTFDYGIFQKTTCRCRRHHPILKSILGREQDFFIDKTGFSITFTGHNRPVRPVTDKVQAYQYVQEEPGKVILKIQPKVPFNSNDRKTIHDEFHKIWHRFDLDLQFTEKIDKTSSGKHLYLKRTFASDEFSRKPEKK